MRYGLLWITTFLVPSEAIWQWFSFWLLNMQKTLMNHLRATSEPLISRNSHSQQATPMVDMKSVLTHWGRVTHICVPERRQAIIWTNAGILLIGNLGTNFSKILIKTDTFSFNKIHLKLSSAKWQPFCLSLNVLTHLPWTKWITFWQTTFSNALSWIKLIEFQSNYLNLFPWVQLKISRHWLR